MYHLHRHQEQRQQARSSGGGESGGQRQEQQPAIKMAGVDASAASQTGGPEAILAPRKLFTFFYVYAIFIIVVYTTYAASYFYYQHQLKKQQQQQQQQLQADETGTSRVLLAAELPMAEPQQQPQLGERGHELLARLESKIRLLERHMEVVSVDLQETKNRLRERERCDCKISCTFNGTRYEDKSSWLNQCDTCTCQAGTIVCAPQKCPPIKCDSLVQLPGQCCPTCMKKCKYNDTLIGHGQSFRPAPQSLDAGKRDGGQASTSKECRCHDGLIKCEPIGKLAAIATKLPRIAASRLTSTRHSRPTTAKPTTTTTRGPEVVQGSSSGGDRIVNAQPTEEDTGGGNTTPSPVPLEPLVLETTISGGQTNGGSHSGQ